LIVSIFHLKDWIISENRADISKKRCEGVNQDKSQRVVQRSKGLRCIVCRVDERDKKAKSGVATSGVPPDWEIEISLEKQRSRLIHTKWGHCGNGSRVFLKNGDGSVLGFHLMCPASNRLREKSVRVRYIKCYRE